MQKNSVYAKRGVGTKEKDYRPRLRTQTRIIQKMVLPQKTKKQKNILAQHLLGQCVLSSQFVIPKRTNRCKPQRRHENTPQSEPKSCVGYSAAAKPVVVVVFSSSKTSNSKSTSTHNRNGVPGSVYIININHIFGTCE